MNEKDFVFNVFLKKLELKNDLLTSDQTIVKFEWGDDKDLNFDIKSNRINVSDFDVKTIIVFKRNVDDFVQSLGSKPFKLTVFEKAKVNASDIGGEGSKDEVADKDKDGGEKEGDRKTEMNLEKVGEAECHWPTKLVSSFLKNHFSPYPFVETYELKDGDEKTGLVTISILLHYKCEENVKSKIKGPYVDKDGKLGAFKEIDNCLHPNDVFFVIGNPPCPQKTGTNILSNCCGRERCPGRFSATQFKHMQGSLINDCNVLGGCVSPGCCEVEGDMELCKEVLDEIQAKTFLAKKRKPSPVCPIDPCERIFGPINESCDDISSTDLDVPCNAEFHTADCARKNRKRQKHKKLICNCQLTAPKPAQSEDNKELIEEILKNNQYDRRKKEILYPHTYPAPELLTTADPLQVRCCSICCEDISWVPPYGMCPKCGFKPSVAPPLKDLLYDDEKTAQDILEQLKEDIKKFRREKKINKFGACNCAPFNECLNCQLRNLSRYRAKKKYLEAEGSEKQSSQQASNARHTSDKENKVDNIISDVLEKQNRSNFKKSDYKIPSLKRVIKWCKKQSDLRANGIFSDSDLCTTSSFSSKSSACGKKVDKGRVSIPECELSLNSTPKKSTGTSKTKRSGKPDGTLSKRRSSKKVKYFNKDEYPGVILGHKDCVVFQRKVPRNMGWLWSASINGSNRGWCPGAVRRETHNIMKYFLKDRDREDKTNEPLCEHQAEDICMPPTVDMTMPTIRVTKKQGQYKVTVHPMHDPSKLLDLQDTRSLPIEFTIEKDQLEVVKRKVKSRLKEMGFRACTCGKPIYECECRGDLERDQLEDALEAVCEELRAPIIKKSLCLSDTTKSESEIDMEFSPPAALVKRPLPKKPSVVYVQTQCDPEDIKISTKRQDVWKINPQDVPLQSGHACGGITKPLPCWPPNQQRSIKSAEQVDKENKPKKTDKSNNVKSYDKVEQSSKKDASKKPGGLGHGESTDPRKQVNPEQLNNTNKTSKPLKPDRLGDSSKTIKPIAANKLAYGNVDQSSKKDPSKKDPSKKSDGPGHGESTDPRKQMNPKQKNNTDKTSKPLKPDRLGDSFKTIKPITANKPADVVKANSKRIQQLEKPVDTLKPRETEKNNDLASKPEVKSLSTRLSTKLSKTPKVSKPVKFSAKSDGKSLVHPIPNANESPSTKPRQSKSSPTTPSDTRKTIAQSSDRAKDKKRTSKSADPQQPLEDQGSPNEPRRSSLARYKARKISKPPVPINKRFSMSQLPVIDTAPAKPRKSRPCRKASLVGVSFKPLLCDKAAVLSCPPPPCEPVPCLGPCFKTRSDCCC